MGAADTVSRTVDALLNDWAQIVHLYTIVHDLAEYFKMGKFYVNLSRRKFITPYNSYILSFNETLLLISEKYNLRNMVSIKSYNYSKLVLAYGPNHGANVTVQWSINDKTFKLIFGKSEFSH